MKVSELTGDKLNEWVARSLGVRLTTWAGRAILDTFGDDHLGETSRIAICRAIVKSVYGEEIPDD